MSSGFFNRETLDKLYQYAVVLTKERSLAYDLLQASLERYLKLDKRRVSDIKNPVAFIKKVIRNQYIDGLRSANAHPLELYDEQEMGQLECYDLEPIVISEIELERLWSRLNFKEREILYYWAVMGFTAEEIAQTLEVPRGTILSRLHRLRKRFASVDGVPAYGMPEEGVSQGQKRKGAKSTLQGGSNEGER